MRKLETFDIIYDNPHGVFRAGDELRGKILLVLGEPIRVIDICLRIKGKAKTQWSCPHGKTTTTYLAEQSYFDQEMDFDYVKEFQNNRLPKGRHELPFQFRLPQEVPSSFEGELGHIRYLCLATMKRSGLKFDVHCRRAFTVIGREDLNIVPGASEAIELIDTQEIICCCVPRGCVGITIQLPKRGFVPGEQIDIVADIINNSRKILRGFVARFKQHVTYIGTTTFASIPGQKETSAEIFRTERPLLLQPGDSISINDFHALVPSLPPRLIGCDIIDIAYTLKIDVGSHLRFEIPLILGTIPVRHVIEESPPPSYPDTPPPTYRECILGRFNIEEGDENADLEELLGDRNFVPKYVFYSN